MDPEDPLSTYEALRRELHLYNPDLSSRPEIIVLNKIDQMNEAGIKRLQQAFTASQHPAMAISAQGEQGLGALLQRIEDELLKLRAQPVLIVAPPAPVKKPRFVVVRKKRGRYRVSGEEVERLLVMTDMENDHAVRHLQLRLKKIGVEDELKRQGAQVGDTVAILGWEFEYQENF
jgi:GTP-binding protein